MPSPPRTPVPLTAAELEAIERARAGGSLVELAGEGSIKSQAAALHALVVLGLERVHEREMEHGYAALAASQDEEDRAYRAAVRRRPRVGTGE